MTGWLIVIVPLIAFCAWMGWVLHKRSPNRPGEDTPRRNPGGMGGGGAA
jgi:hypothetical protein